MSTYDKTHRGREIKLPGPLALIREGSSPVSLSWYSAAGASIAAYADERGLSIPLVASVVAVTSPRVTVGGNVKLARRFLETGSRKGMMASTRAALDHYLETGEIRGPKTGAFALALQGDASAVVVDVWTVRGLGWTKKNVSKRVYREASAVVRSLATKAGLAPREAQAALWYGTRARYGMQGGGDLRMQ